MAILLSKFSVSCGRKDLRNCPNPDHVQRATGKAAGIASFVDLDAAAGQWFTLNK